MPQEIRQTVKSGVKALTPKVKRGLLVAGTAVAASIVIVAFGYGSLGDRIDVAKPRVRQRFDESVDKLKEWVDRQRRWYTKYWFASR